MRQLGTLAPLFVLALAAACASAPSGGADDDGAAARPAEDAPRVVQPGAPGEATRSVEGDALAGTAGVAYTEADVRFMRGMIHHHAQALDMTALVPDRTRNEAVRRMALRIEISQTDEIGLMERWLADRGEPVPDWAPPADPEAGGGDGARLPERPMMPGMLSPEQMRELAAARGAAFDRLFLESMIQHHRGAIIMVDGLFASAGGEESEIFQFVSHVEADQMAEIRRMRGVLEGLR